VSITAPDLAAPQRQKLCKPDYLLLGCTIALLVLGTLMVYSASFVVAHNEFSDDAYFLIRQLLWVGIGSVAFLFGMTVDYHRWRSVSLVLMLVCIALLIAVLIPSIGSRSYGASRWLRLGSFFQIQPSELAKIAIVLYLADWLARRGSIVREFGKGLLPFAIIVTLVAGLVELQPDLGTMSIIVGAAACVFFVAGANLMHIGMLGCVGVLAGLALVSRMSSYRQDRIAAFLDPWSDIQGSGWHTAQGLIALGSGGPLGRGLGESFQKFYWVPNAHTDAIFAIIGEELGFLGSVGLLVLFGILAWRGFLIAFRAPDSFGRLFATGLTCMLTLQALVNIAVVTNSVPYTGITLPLVSFGGSSTVISLLAVGLLLNISRFNGLQLPQEVDEAPHPAAVPDAPRTVRAARRARSFVPQTTGAHRRTPRRVVPQVTPPRRRVRGVHG
jgi:cell division protein FtsW